MSYAQTTMRRTREVSGPGVAGVAVVAKPTQLRPPEWRILDRRAESQRRAVFDVAHADQAFVSQRVDFEKMGETRIKETAVQMKLDQFSVQESAALKARRAQLKELLEMEETSHMEEATTTVETMLEKQSKMRSQARALREKRETQRSQLATQKLDEAWKGNCEALRTLLSKKDHERVDMDRKFQVAQKEAQRQQEVWVEQIYAQSWEMDRVAKHARESANLKRSRLESKHLTDCLDAQVQLLEDNRAAEVVLQEEEKVLRFEQAAMLQEQERREIEVREANKKTLKRIFDKDVRQKEAEAAARVQEQLDADLKLIEQLEREQISVTLAETDKKQRLRRESESYLVYLQEMRNFEKQQEKVRDEYLDMEEKKTNAKRRAQFHEERNKRIGMMAEVVHTLQEQMEAKWLSIMKSRADKVHEAEQIAAGIADLNKQAAQREAVIAATNAKHRDELLTQIDDVSERQMVERLEDAKLSELMLEHHIAEESKINSELSRIASLDMSVTGRAF